MLVEALEMYYTNPTVEVLAAVYESLNQIKLDAYPVLNPTEQFFLKMRCLRTTLRSIDQGYISPLPTPVMMPVVEVSVSMQHPAKTSEDVPSSGAAYVSIPLARSPDEIGDINISRFIKLFGDSSMRIYSAIMARQRVLFVGYNHAACDLAQMVFTAVAMCAPPLSGIIKRAVPYATLSDLSFLEVRF